MIKNEEGHITVKGDYGTLLAELATLIEAMRDKLPEALVKEAVAIGMNSELDELLKKSVSEGAVS